MFGSQNILVNVKEETLQLYKLSVGISKYVCLLFKSVPDLGFDDTCQSMPSDL